MIGNHRRVRSQSPFEDGTHDDAMLPPQIPYDPRDAGMPELPRPVPMPLPVPDYEPGLSAIVTGGSDPFAIQPNMPRWLAWPTGLIRPLCVGALMAIPTLGAATVGTVAAFDEARAQAMVRVTTSFLIGIPTDITVLIGALAGGYALAKSVEKIKGAAR